MIKILYTSAAVLVMGALLSSLPASAHGDIVSAGTVRGNVVAESSLCGRIVPDNVGFGDEGSVAGGTVSGNILCPDVLCPGVFCPDVFALRQEKSLVRRMDDRKKKDRKLSHRVSALAKRSVHRSSRSGRVKAKKTDASLLAPTDAGSLAFWRQRGHLPWPVESRKVIMHFGLQTYMAGENDLKCNNLCICIGSEKDAPVKAVSDGVVDEVMDLGDGLAVLVQHGKYFTIYSDLSDVIVTKGQQVGAGDVLGVVGDAGQLDFRIYDEHDIWLDPEKWLAK